MQQPTRREAPKFLNRTVMDAKTCRDFLALAWPKTAGATRFVLFGVAVFSAVYASAQLLFNGRPVVFTALGMYLLGAGALYLGLWGYTLQLGGYVRRQQKIWKAPTLEKEVAFYTNGFEQTSPLGTLWFGYEEVSRLSQNKRSMLIGMGRNALLLRRGGFVQGTGEECAAWLQEKIQENRRK